MSLLVSAGESFCIWYNPGLAKLTNKQKKMDDSVYIQIVGTSSFGAF